MRIALAWFMVMMSSCDSAPNSADERVSRHLAAIGVALGRAPDPSPERSRTLGALRDYRARAVFPRNVGSPPGDTRPLFIDREGRVCAVGHLMLVSGAGALAQRIARRQNTAWLLDMNDPGIADWAATTGLTVEELARIQPGYSGVDAPSYSPAPPPEPPIERPLEQAILAQLDQLGPEVASCGVYIDGEQPAVLTTRWSVVADGSVGQVQTLSPPWAGTLVAACVEELIAGTTFRPRANEARVEMTTPFVIYPTDAGMAVAGSIATVDAAVVGCECAPGPAVCGENHLTYASACRATCQGVRTAHTGACAARTPASWR